MKSKCLCSHNTICELENNEVCPCKTCIVRIMCSEVCYERYLYATVMFGWTPCSEERFKNNARIRPAKTT